MVCITVAVAFAASVALVAVPVSVASTGAEASELSAEGAVEVPPLSVTAASESDPPAPRHCSE